MNRAVAIAVAVAVSGVLGVTTVACANANAHPVALADDLAPSRTTILPIGTFPVRQYRPGIDPPYEPLGHQYEPGVDPPYEPLGHQFVPGVDSEVITAAGPQVSTDGPVSTEAPRTSLTGATAPPSSTSATSSTASSEAWPLAPPAVRDAVRAQVGRTEEAFDAAARNPSDPTLRDALAATLVEGSEAEDYWLGMYDAAVAGGQTNVAPTDGENTTTLMPASEVLLAVDGVFAIVEVCAVSGDTIIAPDGSGGELIVDEGWIALEQQQVFVRVSDVSWAMFSLIDFSQYEGATSCVDQGLSSSPPASSAP